jgi:kynurenine 3-monooxygenase
MAAYLGNAGYRVRVFEKRPDPRTSGAAGGRSINLALSTRGIAALDRVGLAEPVLADAIRMRGRLMHSVSGGLTFQQYGTEDSQVINSVSRAGLNRALIEAADRFPGVSFHFDRSCVGIDTASGRPEFADGAGTRTTADADLVIGADGAFSAIRGTMQRQPGFDYSQSYLSHGYKELEIPPGSDGGFRMEPNALHIWPRGGMMLIALPNADGSYTCTLFAPMTGPGSFEELRSDDAVAELFERQFPDAVPQMPTLLEDFRTNPVGALVTVRCAPWHGAGKVVLIGDAAHAVVPFYGQGMNASFEDCLLLASCLQREPDIGSAIQTFSEGRKPDADALADLAIGNFLEMRDRVASPVFLARKKLGRWLHRLFPGWFVPIYTMVTFTLTPYAEAVRHSRTQNRVVTAISVVVATALVALIVAMA